jgi:excisionase family DNA binding protein
MPSATQQLELPFSLLDVQGRMTLSVQEVAERLGCTPRHVCELIGSQTICAINIGKGKSRTAARIPVEAFRDFVIRSLTCPWDQSPLRTLPMPALIRLYRDLGNYLRQKGALRS